MRLAWFSPLPPAATGVASCSADVLPRLDASGLEIDRYEHSNAHEFVWRNRRSPYELVVYQMGNSSWHDYMWAYLFHYPGLVVLHDARLHHARGAYLLGERRIDDYRKEFAYNHPHTAEAAAEYVLEGLRGSGFYLWPMVRAVVESARVVAVHNEFVAEELRETYPRTRIERIHLGVPEMTPSPGGRERIRRQLDIPPQSIVFVAFGLMTAEKRIDPILHAFTALAEQTSSGPAPHLVLVGANEFPWLDAVLADLPGSGRVHVIGRVAEDLIPDYLAAGDVSLSLRWPTAQETSGAWAESLSASKPTIITSLPHTADVPSLDARTWRPTRRSQEPIAVSVDLLNEDESLLAAMTRLAADGELRQRIGRAGHAYWKHEHHVDVMAEDYRRVIAQAAMTPAPTPAGLPQHLTNDYGGLAASIAREIGVEIR
jgi:glycosyltransferase involved in cell wall biosynthesis